MIHFATKVLIAAVPAVVLIGCNPSQGGASAGGNAAPAVDQAKVEAYFDRADSAEVAQIIERKRLVERYLGDADEAKIKAILAEPGVLERLLGAAGDERVLEIVGIEDALAGYLESADAATMREIVRENALVDSYLEAADPAEVLAIVQSVREAVTERFLAPDPGLVEQYGVYANAPDSGICRLLNRGPFEGLTTGRGGGTYYSFTTRTNNYDQKPDLQYDRGALSAGFTAGHFGCVQPLDGVALEDAVVGDMTPLMVTESIPQLRSDGRKPDCRAAAQVGKVYAVRSHHSSLDDTLTVIEVVAKDDHGVTIVWRRLNDLSASAD